MQVAKHLATNTSTKTRVKSAPLRNHYPLGRRESGAALLTTLCITVLPSEASAQQQMQEAQIRDTKQQQEESAAAKKLQEQQRIAERQRKEAERAALRDRMGRFIR